jgi:hypothetical protein
MSRNCQTSYYETGKSQYWVGFLERLGSLAGGYGYNRYDRIIFLTRHLGGYKYGFGQDDRWFRSKAELG